MTKPTVSIGDFTIDLDLIVAVSVGAVVLLVVLALGRYAFTRRTAREREETLALVRAYSSPKAQESNARNRIRQFTILPRLGRVMVTESGRRKLRRDLAYAGYSSDRAVTRAEMAKAVGGLVGLFLGVIVASRFDGLWSLALILLPLLGYLGPNLWLRRQIAVRTERISLDMPEAMDLLYLCVNAGQSLTAALGEVSRAHSGPLASEFSRIIKEMQLGVSREEAFRELRKRASQPDLQRFADAMVQTDRAGIPISAVLAEQARAMREKRRSRAREQAQQVGVKILFPLVVCFLPGVFVVVIGPAVIQLLTTFLR